MLITKGAIEYTCIDSQPYEVLCFVCRKYELECFPLFDQILLPRNLEDFFVMQNM